MGLEDLDGVGGKKDDSSNGEQSSSSSSSSGSKVIGEGKNKREYSQIEWVRIRSVIRGEFGRLVKDVLDMTPQERDSILDEAEEIASEEKQPEETTNYSTTRCIVCGRAADGSNVEIEGKTICTHHTAGQIENVLYTETEDDE